MKPERIDPMIFMVDEGILHCIRRAFTAAFVPGGRHAELNTVISKL
jgi:hypothetical protein